MGPLHQQRRYFKLDVWRIRRFNFLYIETKPLFVCLPVDFERAQLVVKKIIGVQLTLLFFYLPEAGWVCFRCIAWRVVWELREAFDGILLFELLNLSTVDHQIVLYPQWKYSGLVLGRIYYIARMLRHIKICAWAELAWGHHAIPGYYSRVPESKGIQDAQMRVLWPQSYVISHLKWLSKRIA